MSGAENESTRLLWRTILEEWTPLHALAALVPDPTELATRIEESFREGFDRFDDPFLRHVCLRGLDTVDFEQIADRLLRMVARQRQNETKREAKGDDQ
jgi:hypothetical protein